MYSPRGSAATPPGRPPLGARRGSGPCSPASRSCFQDVCVCVCGWRRKGESGGFPTALRVRSCCLCSVLPPLSHSSESYLMTPASTLAWESDQGKRRQRRRTTSADPGQARRSRKRCRRYCCNGGRGSACGVLDGGSGLGRGGVAVSSSGSVSVMHTSTPRAHAYALRGVCGRPSSLIN